jgi:hypothetical protein
MAFTRSDFELSDREIAQINEYISRAAERHAQAGEDPPDSVKIEFCWIPGFGRTVTAYFDGAVDGVEIEG